MTDLANETTELRDLVMDCIDRHQRAGAPPGRRGIENRYFQHCACGWFGFPHRDHQTLMVYTAMLRSRLSDE